MSVSDGRDLDSSAGGGRADDRYGAGRLPVVVVGAGAMGRHWLQTLADSPDAIPVGIVDLDLELARAAAADLGLTDAVVGADLADVATRSGAVAVIDVTVPQAHLPVNEQALRLGLPVLCEKPLAPTLSDALRQVALADVTGGLLMVSQSRRYFTRLASFRDEVRRLGALGVVTAAFLHADHEPGFREQMAHPLLVDMSIHHFDALRYLTGDEPVAVRCDSWNPPWSWFAGDAAATAEFELASGARFQYVGSRSTPGLPTSWNADWRVQSELGAVSWDGDDLIRVDRVADSGGADAADSGVANTADSGIASAAAEGSPHPEEIEGSLHEFVGALRSGSTPQNEVRLNVLSLAMVEGAIRSSASGGDRVVIADLLEEALAEALRTETRDDVSAELRSWGSAAAGLARAPWGSATDADLVREVIR